MGSNQKEKKKKKKKKNIAQNLRQFFKKNDDSKTSACGLDLAEGVPVLRGAAEGVAGDDDASDLRGGPLLVGVPQLARQEVQQELQREETLVRPAQLQPRHQDHVPVAHNRQRMRLTHWRLAGAYAPAL